MPIEVPSEKRRRNNSMEERVPGGFAIYWEGEVLGVITDQAVDPMQEGDSTEEPLPKAGVGRVGTGDNVDGRAAIDVQSLDGAGDSRDDLYGAVTGRKGGNIRSVNSHS